MAQSQPARKNPKPGFLFDSRETESQRPAPLNEDKTSKVRKKPDAAAQTRNFKAEKKVLRDKIKDLRKQRNVHLLPDQMDGDGDPIYNKIKNAETYKQVKALDNRINILLEELGNIIDEERNDKLPDKDKKKKPEEPAPLKKLKTDVNQPLQLEEDINMGDVEEIKQDLNPPPNINQSLSMTPPLPTNEEMAFAQGLQNMSKEFLDKRQSQSIVPNQNVFNMQKPTLFLGTSSQNVDAWQQTFNDIFEARQQGNKPLEEDLTFNAWAEALNQFELAGNYIRAQRNVNPNYVPEFNNSLIKVIRQIVGDEQTKQGFIDAGVPLQDIQQAYSDRPQVLQGNQQPPPVQQQTISVPPLDPSAAPTEVMLPTAPTPSVRPIDVGTQSLTPLSQPPQSLDFSPPPNNANKLNVILETNQDDDDDDEYHDFEEKIEELTPPPNPQPQQGYTIPRFAPQQQGSLPATTTTPLQQMNPQFKATSAGPAYNIPQPTPPQPLGYTVNPNINVKAATIEPITQGDPYITRVNQSLPPNLDQQPYPQRPNYNVNPNITQKAISIPPNYPLPPRPFKTKPRSKSLMPWMFKQPVKPFTAEERGKSYDPMFPSQKAESVFSRGLGLVKNFLPSPFATGYNQPLPSEDPTEIIDVQPLVNPTAFENQFLKNNDYDTNPAVWQNRLTQLFRDFNRYARRAIDNNDNTYERPSPNVLNELADLLGDQNLNTLVNNYMDEDVARVLNIPGLIDYRLQQTPSVSQPPAQQQNVFDQAIQQKLPALELSQQPAAPVNWDEWNKTVNLHTQTPPPIGTVSDIRLSDSNSQKSALQDMLSALDDDPSTQPQADEYKKLDISQDDDTTIIDPNIKKEETPDFSRFKNSPADPIDVDEPERLTEEQEKFKKQQEQKDAEEKEFARQALENQQKNKRSLFGDTFKKFIENKVDKSIASIKPKFRGLHLVDADSKLFNTLAKDVIDNPNVNLNDTNRILQRERDLVDLQLKTLEEWLNTVDNYDVKKNTEKQMKLKTVINQKDIPAQIQFPYYDEEIQADLVSNNTAGIQEKFRKYLETQMYTAANRLDDDMSFKNDKELLALHGLFADPDKLAWNASQIKIRADKIRENEPKLKQALAQKQSILSQLSPQQQIDANKALQPAYDKLNKLLHTNQFDGVMDGIETSWVAFLEKEKNRADEEAKLIAKSYGMEDKYQLLKPLVPEDTEHKKSTQRLAEAVNAFQHFGQDKAFKDESTLRRKLREDIKTTQETYKSKLGQYGMNPQGNISSKELQAHNERLLNEIKDFEDAVDEEEQLFKSSETLYSKFKTSFEKLNKHITGEDDEMKANKLLQDPVAVRAELKEKYPDVKKRKNATNQYIKNLNQMITQLDELGVMDEKQQQSNLETEYKQLVDEIKDITGLDEGTVNLKNLTLEKAAENVNAMKEKRNQFQVNRDRLRSQIVNLKNQILLVTGEDLSQDDDEKTVPTIAQLELQEQALKDKLDLQQKTNVQADENTLRDRVMNMYTMMAKINPTELLPRNVEENTVLNMSREELIKRYDVDRKRLLQMQDDVTNKKTRISQLMSSIKGMRTTLLPHRPNLGALPAVGDFYKEQNIKTLSMLEHDMQMLESDYKNIEKEVDKEDQRKHQKDILKFKQDMADNQKNLDRQEKIQAQIDQHREQTVRTALISYNGEMERHLRKEIENKKLNQNEGFKLMDLYVRGFEDKLKIQEADADRFHQKILKSLDQKYKKELVSLNADNDIIMKDMDIASREKLQDVDIKYKEKETNLARDFTKSISNQKNRHDLEKQRRQFVLEKNILLPAKHAQEKNILKANQYFARELKNLEMDAEKRNIDTKFANDKDLLLFKSDLLDATNKTERQFQKQMVKIGNNFKNSQLVKNITSQELIADKGNKGRMDLLQEEHKFQNESEQKAILSAQSYIDTAKHQLNEAGISYADSMPIATKEEALDQKKYFKEKLRELKEIPAKRKKIQFKIENLRRLNPEFDNEIKNDNIDLDDIDSMDMKELEETSDVLDNYDQNLKTSERINSTKKRYKDQLNSIVETINDMRGSKDKINEIEYKNAPENVTEFERQETNFRTLQAKTRSELQELNTKKSKLFTSIEEQRAQFSPELKKRLPSLTKFYSTDSQKNKLMSSNITDVSKDVLELNQIYEDEQMKLLIDTQGRQEKDMMDTSVESLRHIVGDPTMLYKVLKNASEGKESESKLDPIQVDDLRKQTQELFEKVSSSEFLKETGRNKMLVESLVDSAKQMYQQTGLPNFVSKWSEIEDALSDETQTRKKATVPMLAKSAPLSEMYLISLAADYEKSSKTIENENPVKIYTAMKSMGIPVNITPLKGLSLTEQSKELLKQIPAHLIGETSVKKTATIHEINEASWRKQLASSQDSYSNDWIQQHMISGNTQTEAVRNIMNSPDYSKSSKLSRLDMGTGNFYPVSGLKQVKAHEPYFINKPSAIRNFHPLKKDRIMHETNALNGPFGLAYANDKKRRGIAPLYQPKSNYSNLARFLNALPATKTFLNKKEKLLQNLRQKKRPLRKKVKREIHKRRKNRQLKKKLLGRRAKKKKVVPKENKKDDEKGGGLSEGYEDDDEDDDFIYEPEDALDIPMESLVSTR